MNKKILLLFLATAQAQSLIEARGGGGGHGGGGHGGGHGGGGHSRSGGHGEHGGHGGHGGYGHGGYGHGGGFGWGGFGVGIASGMLIGLAVSAPAYYNNPSTAAQQDTVNRITDLQKQVYDLQQQIDKADDMKTIKSLQNQIKNKSNEAQKLIDATPE